MKKLLLPLATVLAAFPALALTETPIITYDYSKAYEPYFFTDDLAGTDYVVCSSANSACGVSASIKSKYYDSQKGLMFFEGPTVNTTNPTEIASLKSSVSIVDLGGEVGRVLCLSGEKSPFSSLDYFSALGADKFTSNRWLNTYWTAVNPITSTTSAGNVYKYKAIKVKMTFKIYSASGTSANMSIYYPYNGTIQEGTSVAGTSTDWANADWQTYECTFAVNEQFPMIALKNGSGGTSASLTYLVKSVEFIGLDESKTATATLSGNQSYTIAPTADHTVVTLGNITNGTFDASSYKLAVPGSELSNYPAYFANVNTFNTSYSIIPDINKTNALADGESLSFEGTLNGTKAVSVEGVTSAKAIEGNLYYLPFASSYTFAVGEASATTTNAAQVANANITIAEEAEKKYQGYDGVLGAIFMNTIDAKDDIFAGYATFAVEATDNDNEAYTPTEVGVLSENALFGLGLEGYAHLESADSYVDAEHNWASIAIAKGSLPLHFNGVKNGKITTTVSAVYPVLESLQTSKELANVAASNLNLTALAKSESKTCDLDFSEITDQTSVANIAVEANAAVEYFNLQGVRVAADALTPGIYVRRAGNTASKVIVK